MIRLNKKLVYLFIILVAGLFAVSACEQAVGRPAINRNLVGGGDLPQVRCGDMLERSVTLTQDLNCNGRGLYLLRDNLVLNCNGHTISGYGTSTGIYIDDSSGVVITNCIVRNFDIGIRAELSHSIYLLDNRIIRNRAGIILYQTSTVGDTFSHVNNNIVDENERGIFVSDPRARVKLDTNHVCNNRINNSPDDIGISDDGRVLWPTDRYFRGNTCDSVVIYGQNLNQLTQGYICANRC